MGRFNTHEELRRTFLRYEAGAQLSLALGSEFVMQLAADEAEERWCDLEAAVDATASIDDWCSGPDWVLPVARAFAPEVPAVILEAPGAGFALLARHQLPTGEEILAGLEPLWGFASPIVGQDPEAVSHQLTAWLKDDPNWTRLVLPGLPDDGNLVRTIAGPLSELGELGLAEGITRQVIDLSTGADPWLERRSRSFRRNLRTAQRRAEEASVNFVELDNAADVFDRMLAIERTSWKGLLEDGITSPEMTIMYRQMIDRLQRRGRLRVCIAQIQGHDVGYILGGVRKRDYRGLQLSYSESSKHLSISHLLQAREILRLCDSGVERYDMGMDMDYKRRWADQTATSVVLILDRDEQPQR